MTTEVRVELKGDVEKKFEELKTYLEEHFAIEKNADILRFLIVQQHQHFIKSKEG